MLILRLRLQEYNWNEEDVISFCKYKERLNIYSDCLLSSNLAIFF